jgi:hypothetical protein
LRSLDDFFLPGYPLTSLRDERPRRSTPVQGYELWVALRLSDGGQAGSADFGFWSSKGLGAVFAGWTVERESVVVDGVRVCFAKAGDAVVFGEHGIVAFRNRIGFAHAR